VAASIDVIFDCPLPAWLIGAVGAVVLAVVIFLVRADTRRLGPRRRGVILTGAALATLMLIVLALSPKLMRTWPDPNKPVCAVLVDASRSMLLKDRYAGAEAAWLAGRAPAARGAQQVEVARVDAIKALLSTADNGWLGDVKSRFELAGWRFAADISAMVPDEAASGYAVDEQGYSTAIGRALDFAAGAQGATRPRAVVLISDGAWNAGPDPSAVARMLGRMGIAVYVVALGNPEPPREVTVLALRAPRKPLLGDKMFLRAQIAATGMGAARMPVELVREGQVIARKQVVTLPSGRSVNVTFSVVPAVPGRQHYTVRIPAQAGEQDESNNSAGAWVEVVERKIHVLLVEDEPRWEFRFIRNVFERDPAISLDVCLFRPGLGPIVGEGYRKALPTDKKELGDYDLVMLGDVDIGNLPGAFLGELVALVKRRGGALVVLAGRRGHYRSLLGTPVADILPVAITPGIEAPPGRARPFHVEPTPDGVSHLVTRLSEQTAANEDQWIRLPKLHWSAGVAGLVRGATALLVHPYRIAGTSKLPLLAVQRVGSGKVMFCGTDETWRWRKAAGDKYHYRFWAQAVRWMVKKRFGAGDPRGQLSIDRDNCDVGETVELEAYCLDPDGFPLPDAQVRLQIEHPDGRLQQLTMSQTEGGWGIYRADFTPQRPGKYKMQPIVPTYGDEPLNSSVELEAQRVDLERHFLAQDRNALRAIAQASGGEYFSIGQVDRLPSMLNAKTPTRKLTAEYSPCRHWAYFVLLAGILAGTWLTRKRGGLA